MTPVFNSPHDLDVHIRSLGHRLEIPDPLYRNDWVDTTCDECGALLQVWIGKPEHQLNDTMLINVSPALLHPCSTPGYEQFEFDLPDPGEDIPY
jgi:hypothetical protein